MAGPALSVLAVPRLLSFGRGILAAVVVVVVVVVVIISNINTVVDPTGTTKYTGKYVDIHIDRYT